jgi:hypothetical protein
MKSKTKSTKRKPACDNTDLNATEFQVYYSVESASASSAAK